MILHTVPGSPNGRKVLATLLHLGLGVEIRNWNLFKGELRTSEYLAINPNAKVPLSEHPPLCRADAWGATLGT